MIDDVRLFGTDGIRGRVSRWPLTAAFVVRLGQALAQVIREGGQAPLVLIGRDTRASGPMLESALMAGLLERGIDAFPLGVMPSPGVAYLCRHFGAGLGIVISASHNPASDNGLKLFTGTGFKVPPEMERKIEAVAREIESVMVSTSPRVGRVVAGSTSPQQAYLEALASRVGRPKPLQGWNLVLDCAHGATYQVAPDLFRRLGARVSVLFAEPDGQNINQGCGTEHPQALREAVLQQRADAGLAFDGDGDRLLLVDEQGSLLDGDDILHILSRDLYERGQLQHRTVVGTVMSNLGLERALSALGGSLERVPVGDRNVARRMLEGGFTLGGEPSGHIILFGEGGTTGDGLYTAMKVLGIVVRRKQALSTLTAGLRKFPQTLVNVPVSHKPPLSSLEEVAQAQDMITERLGDRVRVLLRYSGTQPLLRVMVEGEEAEEVDWAAQALAEAGRQALSPPGEAEDA